MTTPNPAELVRRIREQILRVEPGDLDLAPTEELPRVWGVIMELGYALGVTTLVALAEGTTSLYFNNGAAIIGAGEHSSVRAAAEGFLAAAEWHLEAFEPAESTPLPRIGRVRFYLRTFSGTRTADADQRELGAGPHPLAPVYQAGHGVITAIRLASEA